MITKFKMFENNGNIKKYIVYQHKRYYIDEFINIENGTIYFKNICHYSKFHKKIKNDKIDDIETANFSNYLNCIKFTSDDLSECENFIDLYFNINKYNL